MAILFRADAELINVFIGHLDELQKAEKYPIPWSL